MTYRELLRDHAQAQYGYVTTRDAAQLAVPGVELRKLAARGALRRVGHGVYRVNDVAATTLDEFAAAVLLVGPGAYLTHDAVLALHGLALVNPRKIRVGTARRVRVTLPPTIEVVHRNLPAADLTEHEGIPCTIVERAIMDCRGQIMDERLVEATREAERQGLLSRRSGAALRRRLQRKATT